MVIAPLLRVLHQGGAMGHDKLETAMFWVGAMLAFMPVLVGIGVFGFVRWQRRNAGRTALTDDPTRLDVRESDRHGST